MQITNEILLAFINCPYKGYLKKNGQNGIETEYHILLNKLKENQKNIFTKSVADIISYDDSKIACDKLRLNVIYSDIQFVNDKINIKIDAIQVAGNKKIIATLISPLGRVTPADKLYLAIKASLIHREFNIQIESCRIIFGQSQKQTIFKVSSFSRPIKNLLHHLDKTLSSLYPPAFFKNKHCLVCEFQNNCIEKLRERDDLSLLTSLKPKEILQKYNRGIFSVKQLSYLFRPKKNPYQRKKFLPELKALAIREGKTFIIEVPEIKKAKTEVYLDIEGISERGSNYLIGVIVKNNKVETEYSFWANSEDQQIDIFRELLNLLKELNSFTIYHYGSYEIQALRRVSTKLSAVQQDFIKTIINNSFNVLNVFSNNIYPPTYSNSLKEIARFLKFEWTDRNASGLQSVVWRYDWELTQNEQLKNKLITYNIEDCRALIKVKEWAERFEKDDGSIALAKNFKSEDTLKWGNTNYIIKEFEEINSKAYFDYQRTHIFLRTEKGIYTAIKKQKHVSKIYNKPDKNVDLFPTICPICKSKHIVKIHTAKKLQVDMVFMKQGIKKKATLYTGGPSICGTCKEKIISPNMRQIPLYGRNLMIWSVNQKIQYGQSSALIINFLKDSLKIAVSPTQMTGFKNIIAKKYLPTYTEIMHDTTRSTVIHIDETIARIKGIDGYVWVFTNYDSVYYEFRETRESDFLKERLNNFNGVLVSDFYTGYDSMECKQQKCLIHLIRDMNEDFLKHQLDMEFKTIIIEFGNVLRLLIATIDKFGLKQVHLRKHRKAIDQFYSRLVCKNFESELALSYQKRLVKYREKIFMFIECDNVPWNNNNAEHSIKPFAKWRKKVSKTLTKENIENHLILLSILQTCKYRSINFFEFLKSGETSLSKFSKMPRVEFDNTTKNDLNI